MPGESKLIVLEGVDDALLEAQAERLCRWLRDRGISAEGTREPTHGPVGAQIRLAQSGRLHFDLQSLALFRLADRMDHLGREGGILSQLAGGRVVVCVRYLLSSYAQQWDQVDWTWLRQINAPCRRPDLTLFIDTPVEGAPNARWLRDRYLGAIERLRDEGERIVAVDGGGTADEIQRACQREVILALERTV